MPQRGGAQGRGSDPRARTRISTSQEQLAERAVSAASTWARWSPHLCRSISLDLLFNIASVLEIEPPKLLVFHD